MAVLRRPKTWLTAAAMIFILILLLTFRERGPSHFIPQPHPHNQYPDTGFGGDGGVSTFFGDEEDANLVSDAHRLPSADSFLLHFQAVLQQPGITMAGAKRTCRWPSNATVNFQFSAEVDWVVRDRHDAELADRRAEWHSFVRQGMIPWSSIGSRFSGRGIVVVAGNHDTIQRTKVLLRALRRLRSTTPVEIHYWREELSDDARKELSVEWGNGGGEIFFNDLSGSHNVVEVKKDQFLINFQLKPGAVLNSRFSEILLLDSDNIPLINPDDLFSSAAYTEFGTVFWPDIARTRPQNPMWAISNTPCRSTDEYEQESGQLLVDKRRFWYHLQLASWWASVQGGYYGHFLLGDKDLFRFAWHALRTRYGSPRKWLASVGNVNDGFYCGHSFAQHHPDDGRVAFLHGGLLKTVSPEVLRWNRDEAGGMFRHYKRSPTDEDPSVSVNVGIKFDGAAYVTNHSSATDDDGGDEFHASMCTDMFDVEPRGLDELVPFCESTFREIGGYWQLDGGAKGGEASAISEGAKVGW